MFYITDFIVFFIIFTIIIIFILFLRYIDIMRYLSYGFWSLFLILTLRNSTHSIFNKASDFFQRSTAALALINLLKRFIRLKIYTDSSNY